MSLHAAAVQKLSVERAAITRHTIPDADARAAALDGAVDALSAAAAAAEAAAKAVQEALGKGREPELPGSVSGASLARSLVVRDEGAAAALGAYVGAAAATARVEIVKRGHGEPPTGVMWVGDAGAAGGAPAGAAGGSGGAREWWEAPPGAIHAAAEALLGRVELVATTEAARRGWAAARARSVDLVVRAPPHCVYYATGVAMVPAAGAARVVFGARRCARALLSRHIAVYFLFDNVLDACRRLCDAAV